jgi:hypothetical protein
MAVSDLGPILHMYIEEVGDMQFDVASWRKE